MEEEGGGGGEDLWYLSCFVFFYIFETTNNFCSSKFTHQTQSNAIHWIGFRWVRIPNPIKHSQMDWVQLGLICSIELDWLGNQTHTKLGVNLQIDFDWVQFLNVQLTMPGIFLSTCTCLPNYFPKILVSFFFQHYMTVHAEKKNVCSKCGKGFGLPDACRRHELKCGQLFTCSCGCPYTTVEALLTHARRQMHKLPECYETKKER